MRYLYFCCFIVCFLFIAYKASAQSEYPTGLETGVVAPDFEATDIHGKKIHLYELLKEKPVILFFFRGEYCTGCLKKSSELQDSIENAFLNTQSCYMIGISPENTENIKKHLKVHHYPIIADLSHKIMDAYKTTYKLDEATKHVLDLYGTKVGNPNADGTYDMPMPATYLIGQDRHIKVVSFNKNENITSKIQYIKTLLSAEKSK
jgi:peroxiredoxin